MRKPNGPPGIENWREDEKKIGAGRQSSHHRFLTFKAAAQELKLRKGAYVPWGGCPALPLLPLVPPPAFRPCGPPRLQFASPVEKQRILAYRCTSTASMGSIFKCKLSIVQFSVICQHFRRCATCVNSRRMEAQCQALGHSCLAAYTFQLLPRSIDFTKAPFTRDQVLT